VDGTASTINTWLVFAIPVVMVLFGGLTKAMIQGFTIEAFYLGLESTLVALTECLNRLRACLVHGTASSALTTVALIGVGMLLACILALGLHVVIDRGVSNVQRVTWYSSPWLWRLIVGNFMGIGLLIGVLYLMKEAP
jgi:hypothetical protein